MSKKIAVIRIRGQTGVRHDISDAMKMLKLNILNSCAVVEDNAKVMGQIKKCKDFVTWGPIDEETLAKLTQRNEGNVYNLHPPRGGHARKGIKVHFSKSGALGFRDEKINDLINKML